MSDIFDNQYDESPDGFTPTAPVTPQHKLSFQKHGDLSSLWQQAQRKGLESAYHGDPAVRTVIDAQYGDRAQGVSEAATVAANSKNKVELMRALKRDALTKYGIKD